MAALDYADHLQTYAANLKDRADRCAAWTRQVADNERAATQPEH